MPDGTSALNGKTASAALPGRVRFGTYYTLCRRGWDPTLLACTPTPRSTTTTTGHTSGYRSQAARAWKRHPKCAGYLWRKRGYVWHPAGGAVSKEA